MYPINKTSSKTGMYNSVSVSDINMNSDDTGIIIIVLSSLAQALSDSSSENLNVTAEVLCTCVIFSSIKYVP